MHPFPPGSPLLIAPEKMPELAQYLDEPAQLPSGSFGKVPLLRLRFERRAERSILAHMERRAPLLVQRALYCDEGMPNLPVVFIITNSGGILQGDRYQLEFEMMPGSFGHVTTQAATKIHEMDANFASQDQVLILREGSYLEYLPDPIIPFRHSRFLARTHIQIHPTASLVYGEILAAGRKYYKDGELFAFDLYSSRIEATRLDEGRALFTERFVLAPNTTDLRQPALMGPYDVFGNVVLLTPPEQARAILEQVEPTVDRQGGWAAGANVLPSEAGLIYRVLGTEQEIVKARVRAFWAIARKVITGNPVPPEFPWR